MARKSTWLSALVAIVALAGLVSPPLQAQTPSAEPAGPVVVRLYFRDADALNAVAGRLDIWERHFDQGYVVAAVSHDQLRWLEGLGYRTEVDPELTAQLGREAVLDPRFHYFDDYYANGNGLYVVDFLQQTNAAFPTLTELLDIGNAWEADHGGHPRDMWILRVTNEDSAFGPIEAKPVFFLMAEIHAREVATPELAMRYVKYLTSGYNGQGGYGTDPDATWLVDHNVLYVLVMQNPDGHVVNEQNTGAYRRKNMDNDDGCNDPASWGIDLNRNHSFLWGCCGGSSAAPCDETYRGPAKGSEPETQAFQDFFASVLPDQNGPNGDDEVPPAAPDDATGIFISLHSYADEVLWPWYLSGYPQPPNFAQLQTIGRKLAYWNGFTPTGSIGYAVDGSTDIWTYGKLGIASYTFEVGPGGGSCGGFFPAYGCLDGIDNMPRNFWAENRPAFLYAHKIARTPYITAYGPDTASVALLPAAVAPGTPVELSATVADHRYGNDPLQPIAAAEVFLDAPGADGSGIPLAPADGSWGGLSEQVGGTLDTSGLPLGRHYLLVHGQSAAGTWGPFSAAFLYVIEPGVSPVIWGAVRDASTNAPLAATVTAGVFQAETDPATGLYSMTVISGTYDIDAASAGYVPSTARGIPAHDHQVVRQDFYLYTTCDLWSDDVESGNAGWTADPPWAITDEASHSPAHSWTDSPGGLYQKNINVSLKSPPFDLSGHSGLSLSFWHIYDIQYYWAWGYVEYSLDGGNSWVTAATYSDDQHFTWEPVTLPLPALDDQPDVRLRFRLKTGLYVQQDGWHIDDVVLSGGGPGCVTPTPPTAAFTSNSPVPLGSPAIFVNQTRGTPPFDYLWDFGDGIGTSTESDPHYLYQAPGTYNVTLTATNALGSDTVTHPVTVLSADTVHVDAVKLRYAERRPGRYALLGQVRILDQNRSPIPAATVSARWTLPDGSHADQEAQTGLKGIAAFRLKSFLTGVHELCVTDVVKPGYLYDPDQNRVTCADVNIP